MTRITLAVLAGILALTLAGCSTLTVRSDWDEQADFSAFRSYKVVPIQSPISQLVEKRIMDAVRIHLNERGFVEDETSPNVLVAIHINVEDKVDVQTYNYGYPYRGYGYGMYPYWHGGTDVSVSQYQQGTLIIDFVDASDNELFWRGWGSKIIEDSSGAAHKIQEVVDKILKQYPPK